MKNNELDLCKILKNVKEGTKLYSPITGVVTFVGIDEKAELYPIRCQYENHNLDLLLTKSGRFFDNEEGECMLFPSKENRSWDTFMSRTEMIEKIEELVEKRNGWLIIDDGYSMIRIHCEAIENETGYDEVNIIGFAIILEYYDNGKPVVTLRAIDNCNHTWDVDDYFNDDELRQIIKDLFEE